MDPCGYFGDDGVSQRMSYTALVEGFTPFSIMSAFARGTVQYIFEHEGVGYGGTCGISCIIIAIIIIYSGGTAAEAVEAVRKQYIHRHQEANSVLDNMVTWYHHGFLQHHGPILLPNNI